MPVRVLIADSSAIMREAVRGVLIEEPGIEIVGEACNVHEMIEMRKRFVPDIVIMDLYMAEESKMYADELSSSKSHLLAISASDAEEGSQKAKEIGASAFLDKLWLHTTLIPKIFELCQANG
jgi:two-component system chemotaxis response regulator CheB